MGELKNIPLNKLIVWSDNPRMANEQILSEKEAIDILISEVGLDKMRILANDIFKNGLNPHRQPIVVPNDNDSFNVYDGNRRISIIKCVLSNDDRFPDIKNLYGYSQDSNILVYVTDEKEALSLIEIEHSGEAGGRGQIQWEAFQRDFAFVQNGKKALYPNAFQVSHICKLNRKNDFKQIPYTDLDTIFTNGIVKSLFSIKGDWDYNNENFIQDTYKRLIDAKPRGSYSRYLPQLKTEEKILEFKNKLFPDQAEDDVKTDGNTNNSEESNHKNDTIKNGTYDNNKTSDISTTNSPSYSANKNNDEQTSTNQSSDDKKAQPRNSYTVNPTVLFNWRGKGINIDDTVFKPTLEFAIGLQINTSKELKRIAAYLYRLLLEIALKYWCNWFRCNKSKFNTGSLTDYEKIDSNILGTTSSEVSFISSQKVKNIIIVLECIKDTNKNKDIRECFKGKSVDSFSDMVDELNEVIHGSKEFIDNKILEKYDEMTLNYLTALSISMK